MTWELTDDALAAIWITLKVDIQAITICLDDILPAITSIDVWFGGFNVVHYAHSIDAVMMNMLLKQSRTMILGNTHAVGDIMGICFPILFGAPYINEKMALPYNKSNRKTLTLGINADEASLWDEVLLDITEVILPGAKPVGFIKQEETSVNAQGTGDKDVWLQHNWDLLKLLLRGSSVPQDDAWTQTIDHAGLEIDDFVFGYQSVPWTILHGELMNEITGMAGIENMTHVTTPELEDELEHWIRFYAVMDFFFEKDLKWRAPLGDASTAKLKIKYGVDEAIRYIQANYVPVSKLHRV